MADEILEALEKMDQLAAAAKNADQHLKMARDEGAKIKQRVDAERATLESELARVQANLTEAEGKLPLDFKAEYDRIARVRGENTLAHVDGDTCGNCYQMLTAQTLNDLFMSRPVFCRGCGCLLYLPEGNTGAR